MSDSPPSPAPPAPASEPLRSDVDAGLRFLHVMGMQSKQETFELSSRLYALVEELIARGQLDLRSFEERRERARQREMERVRAQAHVLVADNTDKYALKDLPQIDCASLLTLCKGRCCRLTFPLSFQDLDERVVKWEYAQPYQIKKRDDGYCTHSDPSTRQCGVYAHRPGICRTYDCRADKRIWVDFEKKIPAPEDLIPASHLTRPAP